MPTPVKPLQLLDDVPLPCEGDGHYIAGFAAGEGSFCLGRRPSGTYKAVFSIGLDPSDELILRWIQDACFGIGCVSVGQNVVSWAVSGWAACGYLIRVFEAYPLRAAKARDFALWSEAVRLRIAFGKSSAVGYDWTRFAEIATELRSGRRAVMPNA